MCTLTRAYVWKLERLLIQSRGYIKITTRFKSNHHKVYTEEVNKIALSGNGDKRLQTYDGIETYPYGRNGFKVCESEMTTVTGLFVKNYADFLLYD